MALSNEAIMSEAEKPANTPGADPLPTGEDLARFVREQALHQSDMDEARGKIGALVKNGEKDKNLHRKAFKILCQTEKMDSTKRDEFLRHLYHYLDVRGHKPRDLFSEKPADPPAPKGSRVRRDAAAVDKLEATAH